MKFREILEKITSSWAYPAIFAILSYISWVLNFPWPFVIIESLLCFLPLITSVGIAYQAPLLLCVPLTREILTFSSLPSYSYVLGVSYLLSLIIYIWRYKCLFRFSKTFFPFIFLFLTFLISIVTNILITSKYSYPAMFFVIAMILLLIVSVLNCCVMENHKDTFNYFSTCITFLAFLISIEVFTYYIINPNNLFTEVFTLGWANAKSMVTTILSISMPFFGVLIYRKKFRSLLVIFPLTSLLLLATKSGLFALVIGFIPIVLLAFRSYGKAYQYISLGLSAAFASALALLLAYNPSFREPFVDSVQSLNLMNSSDSNLYKYGWEGFKSSLILGPSAQGLSGTIAGVYTAEGMITPLKNTFITTLYMGGIIGLVFWLASEVAAYASCFLRKTDDKWLFLCFLLMTDIIGITDNTIYNLFFLAIYLLALSAFENSYLYDPIKVKDKYYRIRY